MEVMSAMTPQVVTVSVDDTIVEAARIMRDRNVGSLVVMEGDMVKGVLTDRDIATRVVPIVTDITTATVEEFMSADPVTATPNMEVMEALDIMKRRQVKRLPVVFAGKLQGIVALVDIAQTMEPTTRDLLTGLKESRHNV